MNLDERTRQIARELIAGGITLRQAMNAFEEKYIDVALEVANGNVTRASGALGVHRNTLHNKLMPMSPLERQLRNKLRTGQASVAETRLEIDRHKAGRRA
jgi:DNA-binding NtrC family response regulator